MPASNVVHRHDGKDSRARMAEGEKMLTRYNNGATTSQLMEEFGIKSRATIAARLKQAIETRLAPNVDQYREAQNAMLDDSMALVEQQLEAATRLVQLGSEQKDASIIEKGMALRGKAVDSRLRIGERRARLMGLDRPIQVEQTVTMVSGGVDAELERLAAELGVVAPVVEDAAAASAPGTDVLAP